MKYNTNKGTDRHTFCHKQYKYIRSKLTCNVKTTKSFSSSSFPKHKKRIFTNTWDQTKQNIYCHLMVTLGNHKQWNSQL